MPSRPGTRRLLLLLVCMKEVSCLQLRVPATESNLRDLEDWRCLGVWASKRTKEAVQENQMVPGRRAGDGWGWGRAVRRVEASQPANARSCKDKIICERFWRARSHAGK